MIICGFDPGTQCTGFGILDSHANVAAHVAHGTIRAKNADLALRLREIYLRVTEILKTYQPHEVCIETSFFSINAQSALKLGQARGVIILAATLQDIPVFEYTPTEIKKATCGYGHAEKHQIGTMVEMLLHIPKKTITSQDASDALAVAICHAASRRITRIAL